jgi:hypothetical protein
MEQLDSQFDALLGRQATEQEKADLYRIRDALGLQNNDALWLVLIALQHYKTQYEAFPKAISEAANGVLFEVKESAQLALAASSANAQEALIAVVRDNAGVIAKQVAGKQRAKWLAISVVVASLCLSGVGYLAFLAGLDSGLGRGYQEAKEEVAAASWANTPEGKLAYGFAKAGELQRVVRCEGKGWKVKGGVCYPHAAGEEGVHGWRVPSLGN